MKLNSNKPYYLNSNLVESSHDNLITLFAIWLFPLQIFVNLQHIFFPPNGQKAGNKATNKKTYNDIINKMSRVYGV